MINEVQNLPTSWQWVRLGDHVRKIGSGITPRGGEAVYLQSGIPLIRSQNVHINRFEMSGLAFISSEQDEEMKDTRVFPGDVLLNITGASIGRVCVVPSELCPANVNQHVCIIRTNKTIEPNFLALFLANPEFQSFINSTESGATRQALTKAQIEDFQIPLPPLDEQKRIAAILGKCDRLRRTRRYTLQLSDTFLQSVFLQMFGDPIRNTKGFPSFELQELASVERGKFTPRPRNDPSYFEGNYPFIQTGDISRSDGRLDKWTQTLNEKGKKVSRSFPKETVVIAIVGATIGMTAILDIEVYCPDSVVGIQVFRDKTKIEYIEFLLRFWRPIFLAQAPETARANINLDTLRPLKIPLPPLPLQEKFAQIVQKFERLRTQQREAERQAEHLFQTLLHSAFRGELTSSDFDDEAVSALSKEIGVKQAKPKSTGDIAEYLHTKVSQQETEAVQLTLPGLE